MTLEVYKATNNRKRSICQSLLLILLLPLIPTAFLQGSGWFSGTPITAKEFLIQYLFIIGTLALAWISEFTFNQNPSILQVQ